MQVQVNTSHDVNGSEKFDDYVRSTVEAELERFSHQLTRIEAHFTDVNGRKDHGDDKRCVLEARPAGLAPIVVSHQGATVDDALQTALGKLSRTLETHFGKLHAKSGSGPSNA